MKEQSVTLTTPFIKLDSLLKYACLVGSGGEAKVRVCAGEVLVNGSVCTQRGKKLYPGDEITLGETRVKVL